MSAAASAVFQALSGLVSLASQQQKQDGSREAGAAPLPSASFPASPALSDDDCKVLELGSTLTELLAGSSIDMPMVVFAGSQSSAKSTLMGRLLGVPLAPTGATMTTRAAQIVRKLYTPDRAQQRIEVGEVGSGEWRVPADGSGTFALGEGEAGRRVASDALCRHLEQLTVRVAGPGLGVSHEPIHIRLYTSELSAGVGMTYVDLPGLTAVAQVDRGQPADVKEQVRALASRYLSRPRALIVAVMPARADLEVDMALELVKHHDPQGTRTVAVLTKPDLMNSQSPLHDLLVYLDDDDDDGAGQANPSHGGGAPRLSRSLAMPVHGYFLVCNSGRQAATLEQHDAHEASFFAAASVTAQLAEEDSDADRRKGQEAATKVADTAGVVLVQAGALTRRARSRLGVSNLRASLCTAFVAHVRDHLPVMARELRSAHAAAAAAAEQLGPSWLVSADTETDRMALMHQVVAGVSSALATSLRERTAASNCGSQLAQLYDRYRSRIAALQPFARVAGARHDDGGDDSGGFSDELFERIVGNCQGNHMRSVVSDVEVLEYCMASGNGRPGSLGPAAAAMPDAVACLSAVRALLAELVESLLRGNQVMARFPALAAYLRDAVLSPDRRSVLGDLEDRARLRLDELAQRKSTYVWTDNAQFQRDRQQQQHDGPGAPRKTADGTAVVAHLRAVCTSYWQNVVEPTLCHEVPSLIQFHLVDPFPDALRRRLFEEALRLDGQQTARLFEEGRGQVDKRRATLSLHNRLQAAVRSLDLAHV